MFRMSTLFEPRATPSVRKTPLFSVLWSRYEITIFGEFLAETPHFFHLESQDPRFPPKNGGFPPKIPQKKLYLGGGAYKFHEAGVRAPD